MRSSLVNYYFDALGRRVAKQVQNASGEDESSFYQTYSYLDQQNKVFLALDGHGTKFLYLDGNGIDEHFGFISKKKKHYFITDHLGSALNDEASGGAPLFGPFGEKFDTDSKDPLKKHLVPVVYGFSGRQLDPESSTYYFRARTYNPSLGRFITKDPIGFAGGSTNLYSNTMNNPVNFTDPNGLFSVIAGVGGSATAVTGGEASGGVYFNPGLFGQSAAAGGFASAGFGAGLNISADAFAGVVFGEASNISGATINQNISLGILSFSGFFSPTTGNLTGFTVGLGASATFAGASTTIGTTGTAQIFGPSSQTNSCGAH